jgi:hypothetical protein
MSYEVSMTGDARAFGAGTRTFLTAELQWENHRFTAPR